MIALALEGLTPQPPLFSGLLLAWERISVRTPCSQKLLNLGISARAVKAYVDANCSSPIVATFMTILTMPQGPPSYLASFSVHTTAIHSMPEALRL